VKKELDLASNREIETKQLVVLPILLDSSVSLPGFLKGKKYADFTDSGKYSTALRALLGTLGPTNLPKSAVNKDDIEELRRELEKVKAQRDFHRRDSERKERLITKRRGPKLQREIKKENREFPEYAAINNAYAFEAGSNPITLQYALHALQKASMTGSHVLDLLLTLENKWQEMENLIEAYVDYVEVEDSGL